MRGEPKTTPNLAGNPPAEGVTVGSLKAFLIMATVWVVLILVALAWLGVWLSERLP